MTPDEPSRNMRGGAAIRSVFITLCIAGYAWVFHQPMRSLKSAFLVAAGLQLIVIVLRRVVPTDSLPQAMYIFEMLVDGGTVLVFALGVYGGILNAPADF